jgi:chromosome segregation ATPase
MIFGMCFGFLLGALVINLYLKDAEETNELLKKTINNLEDDIDLANSKIENRDRILNDYQEENVILLNNSAELRAKITDLENNIELLVNNLSDKNKELISDYQSQN